MQRNPDLNALFDRMNRKAGKPVGMLQKMGAAAVAVIVFGMALAFSVMFFAVVAAIALVGGIYFWWKTRDLRKVMREAQAQAQAQAGDPSARRGDVRGMIIEGEVVREVREDRRQP